MLQKITSILLIVYYLGTENQFSFFFKNNDGTFVQWTVNNYLI